jgi:YD repeat-containing protein
MSDVTGTTTYVQYGSRARLTFVGKPAGELFYNYDLAGNLTSRQGPNSVTYTYDALNRLSTVNEGSIGRRCGAGLRRLRQRNPHDHSSVVTHSERIPLRR